MGATIPLAVAANIRSPGLWLLVNLYAGQSSPGSAPFKVLLIAPKSSSGTITPDTELATGVGGEAVVAGLLGSGTPGHLASKALFAEYGMVLCDVVAPLESAGVAATGTFTYAAGPPTATWDITFKIAGRTIVCQWVAGATDIAGAAAAVTAINAKTYDLPITAANGGTAVVTLTAKVKGLWGNDILISVTQANGTTGTVTASGATLASGTQEPDPSNVLTLVQGTEYDYILPCTSNTDAKSGIAASFIGEIKVHMDAHDSGLDAQLAQMVVGTTGTLSTTKTGTGNMNHGPTQYIHCEAGQSLPCEFAGAELGARIREESKDPACNRIGMPYQHVLYGAANLNADSLTAAEVEDALTYGVTPIVYDSSGNPAPARPITSYHKDAGSNLDDRLLDTSRVRGTYSVAKDLRIAIPREFPYAKLSEDIEAGEESPPEGVVEERDVKAFVDSRVRYWISRGVVKKAAYEEAVENGTFIVRVDPGDSSQCDIVLPVKIYPPLAKFSLVVQHVGP